MSVDGLISGMDTTSLISQLVQAEAGPKRALESKALATKDAASAYRTVNTAIASVRAAAESMLKPESWTATKASSTSPNVAVSSSPTATPGSLTFTVDSLASAHSIFRTDPAWTSATSPAGFASFDLYAADGVTKKDTITVGGSQSLTDVAAAINGSTHGLTAAVVKNDAGTYTLQVSAKSTGADNAFSFQGAGTFLTSTNGTDAKLTIGTVSKYSVTSDTNTFASVLPGVTITANKADTGSPVTVEVSADPEAVAAKVQSLVDAVNAAVDVVKKYTDNSKGSTQALRGDYSVTQMVGQLLDAVSFAIDVDGTDRSPATVGFQLNKDVKDVGITFDKSKFLAALKDDPTLAQRMVGGTAASDGPLPGPADDVAPSGIAGRLLDIAKRASDSATGSLVKLAENQDAMLDDIQERIEAWDLRLAKRTEALTRQFTAMETALSSLRNQSTWLAGQINSLPSYS